MRAGITLGSVSFAIAPTYRRDDELALIIRLFVGNSSSSGGCLSDFAVRLERVNSEDGTAEFVGWFFPVFYVDTQRYVEVAAQVAKGSQIYGTSDSIRDSFSVLFLDEGYEEDFYLSFQNRPRKNGDGIGNQNISAEPMKVTDLRPGTYDLFLLKSDSRLPCVAKSRYEAVGTGPLRFQLDRALLQDITDLHLVQPLDAARDIARSQLVSQ